MGSPSFPATPSSRKKKHVAIGNTGDGDGNGESDLAQSLEHLSLTAPSPSPSPSPAKSPRNLRVSVEQPPSTPRPGSSLRSPLHGPTSATLGSRSPQPYSRPQSRSGTPTLLRKASLNSLHSSSGGVIPARRASSANMAPMPRSPLRAASISPPEMPELPESRPTPAYTASSIATDFFKGELSLRHGPSTDHSTGDTEAEGKLEAEAESVADTVVILHDACYGHRYSRPRTSRAALNTIVERPERIQATVLGVSAAYVRLGDRHADGAHSLRPDLDPASIPTIPFRIQKTTRRLALASQTVTNVHGSKWMEELKIMCDSAETRLAMNGKELQRPDMDRGADQATPPKFHEGDLYLCADSLAALEGALGGVCEAVDAVFERGGPKRAFVAIRPPGHHCSASYPSGFCWINNVHVGIMHAILGHGLTHAAIIDFDLHHGDGSQSVAWQHNTRSVGSPKNAALWKKTSVGYFSLHDINSYPCEMGDEEKVKNASLCIENAHGQNIWNVHLQPWASEAEFWKLYESKYSVLLDKTRAYLQSQAERLRSAGLSPKAAIFLSAGFDASEWEGAGMQRHSVNVPTDFYARFSRDIVRLAAEEGTCVEGRVISVLEGGYSDRALYSGVLSHLSGLAGGDPAVEDQGSNGLGSEMGPSIGTATGCDGGRRDSSANESERAPRPYEPSWWSVPELEKMEDMVAPRAAAPHPAPPVEPHRPRHTTPPTYSSPTQSSAAKVVGVPKVRRSMSGLSAPQYPSFPRSRAPTPPPPEVPWTVAAYELSRLLIPSGRQTGSCTHEDLAAEATRARQARQSALSQSASVPATPVALPDARPAPTRMALRERKAKPSLSVEQVDERKNRRKTVAGPMLTAETGAGPSKSTRAPSRRLSTASTVVVSDTATLGDSFRPETSQSIRPESSMSVRTTATNPLGVRKIRTANQAKREAVAGPRQPKQQRKAAPAHDLEPSSSKKPSAGRSVSGSSATASARASPAGDGMEQLTGELKKVRITILTKAQKEAREQERRKRENQAQAEIPETVQAAAMPVPVAAAMDEPVRTPAATLQQAPSPTVSSANPPAVHPPRASSASGLFNQHQPEESASPTTVQQQPLQRPPANVSTPVAGSQIHLPVFTSTSTIPFASPPGDTIRSGMGVPASTKQELPVSGHKWEIPETPQH